MTFRNTITARADNLIPEKRNKDLPGMTKFLIIAFVLLIVDLLSGCGIKTSSESFLREDIEIGYVRQVAVLPFENHSDDEYAAARAEDFTITQGLALGLFDIVDKGLVDSILREEAIEPGTPLDLPTVKRLGKRLNVQALLLGSVDYAKEVRRGNYSYPEFSITLRLIDVGTAIVLWQTSGHGSGYSLWGRLFGLAPRDIFQVELGTIKDILETIPSG